MVAAITSIDVQDSMNDAEWLDLKQACVISQIFWPRILDTEFSWRKNGIMWFADWSHSIEVVVFDFKNIQYITDDRIAVILVF